LAYAKDATLNRANPEMVKLFKGMVQEYGQMTGKTVTVREGFRTYEQQAALREKKGNAAAKPGNSMHEFGLAIDIDSVVANEMDKLGLMRKYGFTRPIGGEPWHLEPAGIQKNVKLARDNRKEADLLVETSPFRGGGGYAMVADAKKYGRNQALAVSLLNREPDMSQMSEQPSSEDSAMQRDVADAKKEIDKVVANSDGSKASVQEDASKTKDLPSPEEVKNVKNAAKSETATGSQGGGGGGGEGGGGGGGGSQGVPFGGLLKEYLDSHTHPTPEGESGPPSQSSPSPSSGVTMT
jgi:uncharacterized membrane protein YgcG